MIREDFRYALKHDFEGKEYFTRTLLNTAGAQAEEVGESEVPPDVRDSLRAEHRTKTLSTVA
jgi:hypothetical protein